MVGPLCCCPLDKLSPPNAVRFHTCKRGKFEEEYLQDPSPTENHETGPAPDSGEGTEAVGDNTNDGNQQVSQERRLQTSRVPTSRSKRRGWSVIEISTLALLHAVHGNKWSVIARHYRNRHDGDVKNIFHSALRSKATEANCLLRAYAQAVGPNCDDPRVRQAAYDAARQQFGSAPVLSSATAYLYKQTLSPSDGTGPEEGAPAGDGTEPNETSAEAGPSHPQSEPQPQPRQQQRPTSTAGPSRRYSNSSAKAATDQDEEKDQEGGPGSVEPQPAVEAEAAAPSRRRYSQRVFHLVHPPSAASSVPANLDSKDGGGGYGGPDKNGSAATAAAAMPYDVRQQLHSWTKTKVKSESREARPLTDEEALLYAKQAWGDGGAEGLTEGQQQHYHHHQHSQEERPQQQQQHHHQQQQRQEQQQQQHHHHHHHQQAMQRGPLVWDGTDPMTTLFLPPNPAHTLVQTQQFQKQQNQSMYHLSSSIPHGQLFPFPGAAFAPPPPPPESTLLPNQQSPQRQSNSSQRLPYMECTYTDSAAARSTLYGSSSITPPIGLYANLGLPSGGLAPSHYGSAHRMQVQGPQISAPPRVTAPQQLADPNTVNPLGLGHATATPYLSRTVYGSSDGGGIRALTRSATASVLPSAQGTMAATAAAAAAAIATASMHDPDIVSLAGSDGGFGPNSSPQPDFLDALLRELENPFTSAASQPGRLPPVEISYPLRQLRRPQLPFDPMSLAGSLGVNSHYAPLAAGRLPVTAPGAVTSALVSSNSGHMALWPAGYPSLGSASSSAPALTAVPGGNGPMGLQVQHKARNSMEGLMSQMLVGSGSIAAAASVPPSVPGARFLSEPSGPFTFHSPQPFSSLEASLRASDIHATANNPVWAGAGLGAGLAARPLTAPFSVNSGLFSSVPPPSLGEEPQLSEAPHSQLWAMQREIPVPIQQHEAAFRGTFAPGVQAVPGLQQGMAFPQELRQPPLTPGDGQQGPSWTYGPL